MKIQLPKTEKGRNWTLRVVNRPPMVDGEKCWGRCHWDKREIVIWRAVQKHGVARDTLLHELLHRYMRWMDEDAVDFLATGLDEALDLAESSGILEI